MGHVIKLGAASALRNYTLKPRGEGIAWDRGPANPFSAKVNTASKYDEVDAWNEWVQEDWQTGVGRVDPEAGGFLYAEAETRVPGQIILPPLLQQCDVRTVNGTSSDCRYMPSSITGTLTVGSGGYAKAAMLFTSASTLPDSGVLYHIYARVAIGVEVTFSIYTNNSGSPGTLIASNTFEGANPDRQFNWYGGFRVNGTLSTDTQYWLVIEPTLSSQSFEVAYGTSGYDTPAQGYNGSTWAAIVGTYLLYSTSWHRPAEQIGYYSAFIRFNSVLYYHTSEGLYKYDSVNEQFDLVGTITGGGDVTSVVVFGPTLYFGRSTGNYTTMDTAEAFSAAATTGKLFLEWKGYLWRAYENDVYYSTDGSTWSSAIQIGGNSSEIRGMAGMGDSLYLATDKALFRLAPGNVVEESTRFGTEDSTNGLGMIEYQGRLYIPAGGRLFRFDPSGQMQDIWINRENDLPNSHIGKLVSLARMNNWLVAYVLPGTEGGEEGFASLWIWQEEGWHYLGSSMYIGTPLITRTYGIYYDRTTRRLWFALPQSSPVFLEIPDYTLNPYNLPTYLYQPFGWLEQDKYYGGLYLVDKAFDSVSIVGDNLSQNVNVKVYWQDEDSTEWELLGTAQNDGHELRWPISTRPIGRWVKIGLLLQTNNGNETPRIRAVIVKNLPFPNDKFRDTVTVTLKNYIQMPDGAPDAYTCAQQLAHIQSMISTVGTVIYQDPLGVQYEVAAISYNIGTTIFAYENGANVLKEMEITLTLEQIPDTAYSSQPSGLLLALTSG
jgi:hypothetical protein